MFTQLHQAYLLSGNTGKAIETLERAIRLMPKQDGYYAYLGSLYARIGDSRKAIELYKKTLEMNPVHPKAKVMKFLINKYTKSLNNQK
jgi:tetratricopeptide (TPR) repeat protein